jgi:hypothetical protein
MEAINPKNQSLVNKALKYNQKYDELNVLRSNADDAGDVKAFNKLDRQCAQAFDKYLDVMAELPKYQQKAIEMVTMGYVAHKK